MEAVASLELSKEALIELLMQEYGRRILHLIYLLVKDRSQAEDITQEVFIKVYRNLDGFRQESDIKTWIYRIAVNEAKKHLRSWSIRKIFASSKVNEFVEQQYTSRMEGKLLESLNREEFAKLITRLPFQYRQIIALHYYQDLAIEEVAAVLSLSSGAARNKLYRARKKLKEIMEREGYRWI